MADASEITDTHQRLVAGRLAAGGLTGPAFDVAQIAADTATRIEMDRSLDALIGAADVPHLSFEAMGPG